MRDDNGQQQVQEQEAQQQMAYLGVYRKLMEARTQLAALPLKKSGVNGHMKYSYWELADFLPSCMQIFYELGLCSVVSFSNDVATLTIIDTDAGGEIVITSPMAESNLKGCSPIQSIGSSETYSRRYLWVSAMEILESDQNDASPARDDTTSFLKAISASPTMGLLKSNYDAAIEMSHKKVHGEIIKAKDARKLQLTQGE